MAKLLGNGETEGLQDHYYCPRQGFDLETPSRQERQEKESLAARPPLISSLRLADMGRV
jgi:hypothetical protein